MMNLSNKKFVLLDFYERKCVKSMLMASIIKKVKKKNRDMKVIRVYSNREAYTREKFNVLEFPTFVFLYYGKEVDRASGVKSYSTMQTIIDELLT